MTDRQTVELINGQTVRWADIHMDKKTNGQTERCEDRQMDRHTDG